MSKSLGSGLPEVDKKIAKTMEALRSKKFVTDPIAGKEFSRITSVMSSAYKRHGLILESALRDALSRYDHLTVWHDGNFRVSVAADSSANSYMSNPTHAVATNMAYDPDGPRSLQIDAIVYSETDKKLCLYEVKRGGGKHDAGKSRQLLRDIICTELLAKSYGEAQGFEVAEARAYMVFYYGECSLGKPFSLTRDELDEHFGVSVVDFIEEKNTKFRDLLSELVRK